MLFVDLDGFKQVNDTLGHDAGDQLLEEVARRFDAAIRPSDTLARLGGDEFALLLDEADEPLSVIVAERLLERLSKEIVLAGREMSLGASVGVVVHNGGPGQSEELMRHADLAMYAAKKGGRGRYAVFHHEMGRELGDLFGIEHELRLGLQRGEFSVHYQPQISLESREIVGVEALLRWHSPTRGPVPPSQFIPVAESTGLIEPLGEFVLREACESDCALGRRRTCCPSPSSSGSTCPRSNSPPAESGSSFAARSRPQRSSRAQLGLEVTETTIVAEGAAGDRAMLELQELHTQGVRIAIDDFGTGFSSLAQLRRFPVDMIKVDRSFVQGLEHDPRDEAITTHTVNLAHAIGVLALAEGVESVGQLTSIDELGCDLAQGYLFAHPTPADEVTRQLTDQQRTKASTAA